MPCCFILFHKPEFQLENAADALRSRGLVVDSQANALKVTWGDGPQLRVHFARGAEVRQEAEDIGAGTRYTEMFKGFDSRFEISFDDLNAVLDEINTLIEVQICLQQATGGFLFNSWNGQLTPPDA